MSDKAFNGVTFCIVNEYGEFCGIQTEDPATYPTVVASNVTLQFATYAVPILNSHGEIVRQLAARDKTIEQQAQRIADLEATLDKYREAAECGRYRQKNHKTAWEVLQRLQAALDFDKGEKKEEAPDAPQA